MKEKQRHFPNWLEPWIPESPLYLGILFMTLNAQLGMCDLVQLRLLEILLTASGMLILLYYALQGWPDVKSMFLCGIGYGIIGLAALRIRNFHLLITATTVLAMRNGDMKKALRLIFYWNALFLLGNILFSLPMHFSGIRTIYSDDARKFWALITRTSRFRFGYRSSSAPGPSLFQMICIWCYLNFGSVRKRDAAGMVLLSCIFYFLCANKMSLLLTFAVILLVLVYQRRQACGNPLLHTAAMWTPPVLSVFLIGVMVLYPNWPKVIWELNSLLTNRLIKSTAWYEYRGLTLFGQSRAGIQPPTLLDRVPDTSALDCLYENMGVWMGIAPLCVILICLWLLAKRKRTADSVMILIWALFSIAECDGLNCYVFFPLLLTAGALPNVQPEKPDFRIWKKLGQSLVQAVRPHHQ